MKAKRTVLKILVLVTIIGLLGAPGVLAAEETITGTVQKNDMGSIVISADNGESYAVKGQDLSAMVGKSVQVTGTLEEGADGMSINVSSVEEVKE